MRVPVVIAIGGAVLLAACQPRFDPEDPAIMAAIDSIVQGLVQGSSEVDAEQILATAASDMTFITGDVMLTGLETIRARFEETYAGLESQEQELLEFRIRLLTPDVAIAMSVGEGTYTDKAGWTSEPVGMGTTLVFVRQDGQWQMRHAHQSIAH